MASYKSILNDTGIKRTDVVPNLYIPSDPQNDEWQAYLAWRAVPNTPDPAETAAEISARDAQAVENALKAADYLANLPSWAQVETAITNIANLADAKGFLKKLTRVVYWLAKNTSNGG